jgi:CheY-like chemotaxis protein
MHSAFCNTYLSPIPPPEEIFMQHHIRIPSPQLDISSPKSTTTATFPPHAPITSRHSVQPASRTDSLAGVKATALSQLPSTKENEDQAKTGNTEKAGRQPSWDDKVSREQIVKDPDVMRVLLVEDNEINLKLLVAYMRKLKLSHATACNGLEALNSYKEAHNESKHFDVIFMGMSILFLPPACLKSLLMGIRELQC